MGLEVWTEGLTRNHRVNQMAIPLVAMKNWEVPSEPMDSLSGTSGLIFETFRIHVPYTFPSSGQP